MAVKETKDIKKATVTATKSTAAVKKNQEKKS